MFCVKSKRVVKAIPQDAGLQFHHQIRPTNTLLSFLWFFSLVFVLNEYYWKMKDGPLYLTCLVPKSGRKFVAEGPGDVGQITSWSETAASQDFGLSELPSSFGSFPLIRT